MQVEKLLFLKLPENAEDFTRLRAKLQYIGCCYILDICAPVQLPASSCSVPSKDHIHSLKKAVKRCQNTTDGARCSIQLQTLRLVLFTDCSFSKPEN